ncbi:MAG: ATP-binding protein [bacterium]|nr:ATP-binding protein [bacterium]
MNEKTKRFFNTAGPVKENKHYNIPPLSRVDLEEVLSLIDQEKYFVLHAPRQTGKTSYLQALMAHLNKVGEYCCLYVNVEAAQAAREDVKKGMQTILKSMAQAARIYLKDTFLEKNWERILDNSGAYFALNEALTEWSGSSDKPVVLLLDEVDSLVGDTLISLLRQLRSGYTNRPDNFPQSVILCGVRDVRDYRIHSDKDKAVITGGSAFNIKAESLRMGSFSQKEIESLFLQHSENTGQKFNPEVFPLLWELTEGQPWLVNALGYETCFKMKEGRNRQTEITTEMVARAKENLILRRETHLDQLTDKLSEERVRRVIEPILASLDEAEKVPLDDVEYVTDLGLIKKSAQLTIANRIYREVIPRALTYTTQLRITHDSSWYVDAAGRLDMDKLLTAFQDYFRKNFESWVGGFSYAEAGPQLLLQAFLQRIVNGGGRVGREYGLGRKRTDLLIIWPHKKGIQETVIEMKLRYGKLETTIKKGLEQTRDYMDKCGTNEGYLLVFDRDAKKLWEEKIFKQNRHHSGKDITVYGM